MGGASMSSRAFRRLAVLVSCAVVGATASFVMPAGAAASVNLDQCANDNSPCDWQNGNLNGNNSAFSEGSVVPFRLAIEGLTAGTHTIHINYDFTAGGHKAYDFLATYNATETVDLCAVGGGGVSSLCSSGLPAPVTAGFPSDPYIADGKSVAGAEALQGLSRNLTVFGATAPSISTPTHSGATSGNSTADLIVTFTTAGASSAVLLAWGGHLGASSYWTTDDGASFVSGAPWHMRTLNLDNAGAANQDRSIQPSAITAEASITVVKQTDPDGTTQAFAFDPSWSATNFNLMDGQSVFSGALLPGTYSVAEVNIPAGWDLSSAVCSDNSPVTAIALGTGESVTCVFTNTLRRGTITVVKQTAPDNSTQAFTFDPSWSTTNLTLTDGLSASSGTLLLGTYSVAEVDIPGGWGLTGATCTDGSPVTAIALDVINESVTCTFFNTATDPDPDPETGSITVVKQTDPGGSAESFTFDPSWGSNFNLVDGDSAQSGDLAPGEYSVAEIDIPAGWDLSSAVCSDGSPVGTIDLDAGEAVLCTFTNTRQPAVEMSSITVEKVTNPNGSTETFTFNPSWSETNLTLADGESRSAEVSPGTYSVAEINLPTGWSLSGAICTDGSPVDAIEVEAGDEVTCTFVNSKVSVDGADDTQGDNPTPPLQQVPVVPTPPAVVPQTTSLPTTSSPVAGAELPRTGAGLKDQTFLALLLMLAGVSARTVSRRRSCPIDV